MPKRPLIRSLRTSELDMASNAPLEVFYSYAHEDKDLRDELEKHLKLLQRNGLIANWHDRRIGVGAEWRDEIDAHVRSASIILLLISADFVASDYCYGVEMKLALERHAGHVAIVIPVILRPVDWSTAPFARLQALPRDCKPITTWSNRDEALADVARGIREIVARFRRQEPQEPGDHSPLADEYVPKSSGDFRQRLIGSVFGLVRAAILRSSWPVRALVLGLTVSAGLLLKTTQSVDWSLIGDMSRAAFHRGTFTLTTSEADKFDQAISTLSAHLSARLHDAYNAPNNHDVWEVSQMTVALLDDKETDGKSVAALLDNMRIAACDCWKVQRSAPFQDVASVSWVAFALAKSGQKLPTKEIRLILGNQHNGWWPAFSSATDAQSNASTYATALSLLALNEQMRLGIEEPLRRDVQDSLESGKGWLLKTMVTDTPRWYDYPYVDSAYGKQPIGLSGFVIHVLHRLGADMRDIDARWMRDLPADIPKPTEMNANTINVLMPNNDYVQDTTRRSIKGAPCGVRFECFSSTAPEEERPL